MFSYSSTCIGEMYIVMRLLIMYNQAHFIHAIYMHIHDWPCALCIQVLKPGPRLTLLPYQSVSMCEGESLRTRPGTHTSASFLVQARPACSLQCVLMMIKVAFLTRL